MNLLWQPKLCNLQQLKIAVFTYRSPHFCFPWGRPWGNHAKCCMDGKKIRCLQIVFNSFPVIRTASAKKIAIFTYRSPHFCFPWRRPCDYHAICCMDGKTIQCLPNASQHVPIYLQQFPSYTMLKLMHKSKNRYFYHIFVYPGDAPGAITLNVVWMEREFDAYKLSRCMCLSNYYRF